MILTTDPDERYRGFLMLRTETSCASYVRPSRCGLFRDSAGVPFDAEMAANIHRGRLAEFIDMPIQGGA